MDRVIVDTSVWSLALRRRVKDLSAEQRAIVLHLRELIIEGNAVLIGAIRQEILTGLTDAQYFTRIAERLRDFDEVPTDWEDHERAAAFANDSLRHGVASSPVDMLLCAAAAGRNLPILTTDRDFERYAKYLPIRLMDQR